MSSQGCFDAIMEWAVTSAIFIGVVAGIGALEVSHFDVLCYILLISIQRFGWHFSVDFFR